MSRDETINGIGFSQIFSFATTLTNIIYDAFGKKRNTDTGDKYPDYQATVATVEEKKNQEDQALLITIGMIASASALIYFGLKK